MRLICPVCSAQYVVDDTAIPLTGRNVQCSNCEHAWFQPRPDAGSGLDYGGAPDRAAALQQDAQTGVHGSPARTEPFLGPPPLPVPPVRPDDPGVPARKVPDENVMAVLRDEAERESALRRAEAGRPAEVQAETVPPPLPEPQPEPDQPQVPLSVLAARAWFAGSAEGAENQTAAKGSDAGSSARRDVLKNIDEITQSLRASDEPRDNVLAPAPDRLSGEEKQGFRGGFLLVVVVALLLTAVYFFAPNISAAIPAAQGVVGAYVAGVDGIRFSLEAGLQAAMSWLYGMVGLNNLNELRGTVE